MEVLQIYLASGMVTWEVIQPLALAMVLDLDLGLVDLEKLELEAHLDLSGLLATTENLVELVLDKDKHLVQMEAAREKML